MAHLAFCIKETAWTDRRTQTKAFSDLLLSCCCSFACQRKRQYASKTFETLAVPAVWLSWLSPEETLISLVKKGESRKANQECSYSWTQSATTLPGYTRLLLGFGGMEGGSLNKLFGNTLQVRRACGRLGIKCLLPMSVLLSGFSQNQSNSSCSN